MMKPSQAASEASCISWPSSEHKGNIPEGNGKYSTGKLMNDKKGNSLTAKMEKILVV